MALCQDDFVPTEQGEGSAYESGFVGVTLPPLGSLAMISASDKKKILGRDPPKPTGWSRQGEPLYWQESKCGTQEEDAGNSDLGCRV